MAHQGDPLEPVIVDQLLDVPGHDASELIDRPRVEAAEDPAEVDVMSAESRATESTREPADGARRGEKTVQQQHRALTAVHRMRPG